MDTGPWYWVMGPITTSVEWLRLITLDGWMAGFVKIFCGVGRPEEELVEEAEVRLCSLVVVLKILYLVYLKTM